VDLDDRLHARPDVRFLTDQGVRPPILAFDDGQSFIAESTEAPPSGGV